MKKALLLFVLLLFGCSTNQEIPEEQILYRLNWEGKEIIFYENANLVYTDGEMLCSQSYQMMNSDDGSKRLYIVITDLRIDKYDVYQEGVKLEPVGSFVLETFDEKAHEEALELLKRLNLADEDLQLQNIEVSIYSLDTSKEASLSYETMPESISRKWESIGNYEFRGIWADFTIEDLLEKIDSWSKVSVAKNQVDKYSREWKVSWEGIQSNQLIYSNGMNMHVPEIVVCSVECNGQRYLEVENRMDYSSASVAYYELTQQQWQEFEEWYAGLKLIQHE